MLGSISFFKHICSPFLHFLSKIDPLEHREKINLSITQMGLHFPLGAVANKTQRLCLYIEVVLKWCYIEVQLLHCFKSHCFTVLPSQSVTRSLTIYAHLQIPCPSLPALHTLTHAYISTHCPLSSHLNYWYNTNVNRK